MEIDQPFKRNFDVGKVRTECLTNTFNEDSGITENAFLPYQRRCVLVRTEKIKHAL